MTTIKKISVWLMIVHQFIAWSLYVTPLLFMCAPHATFAQMHSARSERIP